MKLRLIPASITVALFAIACPPLHSQTPNPDWTIYAPGPVNNQTLSISASASHAGAITSLKLGPVEYVNNSDHGRQIQTALQFNGRGECYNPNEAGTLSDTNGPSSASQLWGLTIPSSNRLQTMTNMAYWFVKPPAPFGQDCAVSSGNPSDFVVQKDVTISPAGFPANVIEYQSTVTVAPSPPEAIFSSATEAPAAALQYPLFSSVWTYDLATRRSLPLQELNGEDIMIKILQSSDGLSAFAIFAPELLQPYEGNAEGAEPSAFRWWVGADNSTSALGTMRHEKRQLPHPSTLSYRTYMVVGTAAQVINSLNSLDVKFSALDPDVFSWREYLRLNPSLPQTWNHAEAQSDWLNNGIGQGRAASYRFSAAQYRNLNSDLGWWGYQDVINHYIESGRKEGRATAPRADGGFQHTVVRSPQQDFVPVRTSGANANGQLGTGTTNGTSSPVQLPPFGTGQRPTDVAAGWNTSLAVLADGTVWMWGSNANGARGNGTVGGQNNSPVQVPNLPPIVVPSTRDRHVVAAGDSAYAVVDNTGRVWTWGYGGNGQLGNGSQNSRYTPGVVQKNSGGDLTGIVSISVGGGNFMAALDIDGHVWTWGYNGNGQLGNNTTISSYKAVQAQTVCCGPVGGITQLVTGGSFCLALARDGVIWAWGNNGNGQLGVGNGDTTSKSVAWTVGIPWYQGARNNIDKIAVGSNHALAHARNDGKIYVWGYNGWGQLGLPAGYPVNNPDPTALPVSDSTTNITDIAAGTFFSFLIRANATERKLFGFGDNQSGQLGLNHYMTQTTPAQTNF